MHYAFFWRKTKQPTWETIKAQCFFQCTLYSLMYIRANKIRCVSEIEDLLLFTWNSAVFRSQAKIIIYHKGLSSANKSGMVKTLYKYSSIIALQIKKTQKITSVGFGNPSWKFFFTNPIPPPPTFAVFFLKEMHWCVYN